jgi:hypothetical protein
MKHFFRSLSAVLTAAGIFVFSVIVYGNSTVSDSVESIDGVSGFANQFLSIGKENAVKASGFTNSDGGYKANLMAFDLFPVKEVSVNSVKRRYVGT